MKAQTNTVDHSEIEKFSAMASEWWNPHGKFKPLHAINPLRIEWIRERIQDSGFRIQEESNINSPNPESRIPAPLKGIRLLDIGCGGGLISEPMARLGALVTGIDASEKNIAVAKLHAERSGLSIDYRCTTAEQLLEDSGKNISPESRILNPVPFNVVLALEIVEHVADVDAFVAASAALLKPGGLMIYSTLNRTAKSFALAIVGAEYVLRWLPRGTHSFEKFLRPSELCAHLRHNNIEVTEMTGMVMSPLNFKWRMDAKDLGVNYLVAGKKSA
jgi:2-polyprenyl-6-hydroxyphenyl methylase/3-demethylubiquinone-9 3-methyltransferase